MQPHKLRLGTTLTVLGSTFLVVGLLVALGRAGGQANLSQGNSVAPFEWRTLWARICSVTTASIALNAVFASVLVGCICGIFAWLFAGALAALTRVLFDARWRSLIFWLVVLPLLGNYYLKAVSFRLMISDGGTLVTAARSVIPSFPSLALSPYSAILFLAFSSIPFAFIPYYSTFESISDKEIHAARNLGAGWKNIAVCIIWPRFQSAAIAAFCLPAFFAFGDTLAVSVIGGSSPYVVGYWANQFNNNSQFGEAAVAALVQIFIISVALSWMFRNWKKPPIKEVLS